MSELERERDKGREGKGGKGRKKRRKRRVQIWKVQESEFSLTGFPFLSIGRDSENKGVRRFE